MAYEKKIYWYYVKEIECDSYTGAPIYYKEGNCHSTVTLPTGDDAANLADGCLVRYTGGDYAGKVKTYNKYSDTWTDFVDLGS